MARTVLKEESEIVLSEQGQWFHRGEPFENEKVIHFFHNAIRKDPAGHFFLYNRFEDKEENVYFEVEDTAYFVWNLEFDADQKAFFITLNTGARVHLDLLTLKDDERGVMYCRVLDNDRARFSKWALLELSKYAEVDGDEIIIANTGKRIVIGNA